MTDTERVAASAAAVAAELDRWPAVLAELDARRRRRVEARPS